MTEPIVRTAIAFQGGAALGAFECGVMKALYDARGGPEHFQPVAVTGLSSGAVNAALLAGARSLNPIETLERVWREDFSLLAPLPPPLDALPNLLPSLVQQQLSMFGNLGMYLPRLPYIILPFLAPYMTDSIYDTTPLRKTLERELDMRKLNGEGTGTQVIVSAVNVKTGKLTRFGNTECLRRNVSVDNQGGLQLDHVMASGSLPPGFAKTVIDGEPYWDSGIMSNMPLAEAINCLEACDGDPAGVIREVIYVELFPLADELPTNVPEVVFRFFALLFSGKFELDRKFIAKIGDFIDCANDMDALIQAIIDDADLKQRVDAALAAKGKSFRVDHLRDHPGLSELSRHKQIDAFTKISFQAPSELTNPADFSKATIAARIEAGVQEAKRSDLSVPHSVDVHAPLH